MNWEWLSITTLKSYEKHAAVCVAGLFAVLTVGVWGRYFWPSQAVPFAQGSTPLVSAKPPLNAKAHVFTRALFGEYLSLEDGRIGRSSLDLTIEGIIYSSIQKDALVSLRGSSGDVKVYAVGDKLPGGAVIKKILKDSVVVQYRGKLERISLPVNELRFDKPLKPLFEE